MTTSAPAQTLDDEIELDEEVVESTPSSDRSRTAAPVGAHAVSSPSVLAVPMDDQLEFGPSPVHRAQAAASLCVDRDDIGIASISAIAPVRGLGTMSAFESLLAAAIKHAEREGDLKLRIDVPLELAAIVPTCERHHFNYSRTRACNDRIYHEFYADLYSMRAAR
jgi:hypothetical protein